jgi:hypothetical protein
MDFVLKVEGFLKGSPNFITFDYGTHTFVTGAQG